MEKRVFVSVIRDQELEDFQRVFKGAVLKKIRDVGLVPQEFMQSGIPQNLAWSFENVDRVMQRCVGAVVIEALGKLWGRCFLRCITLDRQSRAL